MTPEEERMLREYAGGTACAQSVVDALGPMSLWSKDAFERELEKARAEEREACAKVADEWVRAYPHPSEVIAKAIRAREIGRAHV